MSAFSPYGAFPFSPLSPVDSEASISPMRPSYRSSVFPRCQPRQIGLLPGMLQQQSEMVAPTMSSLFTDPRWTGINPLFGMWNDPSSLDYFQHQGLPQLLSGKASKSIPCNSNSGQC